MVKIENYDGTEEGQKSYEDEDRAKVKLGDGQKISGVRLTDAAQGVHEDYGAYKLLLFESVDDGELMSTMFPEQNVYGRGGIKALMTVDVDGRAILKPELVGAVIWFAKSNPIKGKGKFAYKTFEWGIIDNVPDAPVGVPDDSIASTDVEDALASAYAAGADVVGASQKLMADLGMTRTDALVAASEFYDNQT
jgi:hypothetical protein